MSRGLGRVRNDVLGALSEHGAWMWARDLVCTIYKGDAAGPDYSSYSSVLRAANGLVKKKLLRSGIPEEEAGYGIERWRTAYWLPSQVGPAERRLFSATEVDAAVLKVLSVADEPLAHGLLVGDAVKKLARCRSEQERLRVPLHRSVKRLLKAGRIQMVMHKRWGVTERCYTPTLSDSPRRTEPRPSKATEL